MADAIFVSNNGVNATVELLRTSNNVYVGVGTDGTGANQGDTDLGAELNGPGNRGTADVTNLGSGIIQWDETYTNSSGNSQGLQEVGIFDNISIGSGVLYARGTFTTETLDDSESIQFIIQVTHLNV